MTRSKILILSTLVTAVAGGPGCRAQRQAASDTDTDVTGRVGGQGPLTPEGQEPTGVALAPRQALGPSERALVIRDGKEVYIDAAEAAADGDTIVDLSNDWTPFIFAEQVSETGEILHNRYRRIFLGLSNDQLDEDGQPLPKGEKNYLELYGIFPTLSVLRRRFVEDAERTCLDEEMTTALDAVDRISYIPPNRVRREEIRIGRLRKELEGARRAARVKTLEELAERRADLAGKIKLVQKRAADKLALAAVEKRLECEGFLKPDSKHKRGIYDEPIRLAVKSFQQKHMIYESHYLRRRTVEALERSLLENNHLALLRGLRERVVSAASILEDGSIPEKVLGPSSNLADTFTDIAAKQLGWDTPEGALAFFKRHGEADFKHLKVAVKFPPLPEYYAPHMDLSIEIDRGDVFYDLPFDDNGERIAQVRRKFPSFTVFVQHGNKKLPLVQWRTTVGGWRPEMASDGYNYYRYKGSDVGPRVIRQVMAGPVWIAPDSTPLRALVKRKVVNGRWQRLVNYSQLGPGHTSAYGVVAGYFVKPTKNGYFDNQIRAHGSSEYLSMYSANGYSHGCHRLPNHLAVRVYSFILTHRNMRVMGDQPIDNYVRQFLYDGAVFEVRIPSRGYRYHLDPPLPVEVLEGDIKGEVEEPLLGYVPMPGREYPGPPPPLPGEEEDRAGGGAGPGVAPEDSPEEEDPGVGPPAGDSAGTEGKPPGDEATL